jgi:uncharacterized protein YbjT (DUF2867 family)
MRSMGTREKMAGMEILVTGAGGFVGAALAPELVARGHAVRAGTRDPGRRPAPAGAVARRFDLDDEASLGPALDGVELAYYLVHSMAQKGEFARRDLHHARAFGRAARAAGVDRVVYLSGLGDEREGLSEHLASRRAVEDALASTGPELTVLRAAIVLGRGGASFEMLVQLVRRLPVMLCPRWVETASQPIALADTVGYLGDAAETEATRGQRLEIGGPEVLSYREMMLRFARLEGRRRVIISVPLFTPGLSSHWIGLVTDVPAAVARPLAEGLRNRVVVSNGAARRLMPRDLATFEEACRAALGLPAAPGGGSG